VARADASTRLEAWSALADVYQGVVRPVVERLESETGLDSGVFSALAYLDRSATPGRLPLSALGALMRVRYSQPGLSRLVQRMEAAGLVERRPDADDGRASIVVTTRSGRARFRRANEVYTDALRECFARHVTADEARALVSVFDAVRVRREAGDAAAPRAIATRDRKTGPQ
jgi:DNA-binding MarR family transcriptional regulator